ncbi:hypothetical protein [Acetobacter oryzoeni]|uniref:hypothetical protein n=1 Tax=Acetobacter oryzoeni TaxID=2500548 RepID=UPI001FCBC0CA|nr:hypothetical protein [Acetobacter oryzoeni]MCP1201822.1 hypothetical protein [Acetobacter oryzoeni]
MPMLPVSLPSVWNIPVAAGVPALMGQSVSAGVQASASVTVGSLLDDLQITQAASQWGIFTQDGQRVADICPSSAKLFSAHRWPDQQWSLR